MIAWQPDDPAPRRTFDLYAAEKRAEHAALTLVLATVRAWHHSKSRAADAARRLGRRHP